MELAAHIRFKDMQDIALTKFGMEQSTINKLADVHGKSSKKMSFEILSLWRAKTAKPTKEVINHAG